MASRYCKVCGGWHSLDGAWPDACAGHFRQASAFGVQIIKDIEPYIPIAGDVDGKRRPIGSRSEHRSFLRRNGYVEVGNETQTPREQPLDLTSPRDVRSAIDQIRSRR